MPPTLHCTAALTHRRIALPALIALLAVFACARSGAPVQAGEPGRGSSSVPPIRWGEPSAIEPEIRVRLASGVRSLKLAGPAELDLLLENDAAPPQRLRGPLTVARRPNGWSVLLPDKSASVFVGRVSDAPLRVGGGGRAMLTIGGMAIPGDMLLVPRPDVGRDAFDAVEHLPLEDYLPGVVAKELYRNWDIETYKAQAIAARSYALHERARQRSMDSHYDVEGTIQDQAYGGADTHSIAQRAVRETRAMILAYRGGPLRAYYSSTCGGRAASARDVWPTGAGFTFNLDSPIQTGPRTEDCKASPYFRWEVTRDIKDLTLRLRAYGAANGMAVRQLGRLSNVRPATTNENGRPSHYRVYDADGRWWLMAAEDLRQGCNFTDGSELAPVSREQRIHSGDQEWTIQGERAVVQGRGFGHGVGMCQFGAEGMAKRGMKHEAILRHFYPGAAFTRAY